MERLIQRPEEKPTLKRTAVETIGLLALMAASAPVLMKLKFPIGTAMSSEDEKELLENPKDALRILAVEAPIKEELRYRLKPSLLYGANWDVGVASSLLFALDHLKKPDGGIERKLPFFQLVEGLYFWQLMRKRGIHHSVVAHATINGILAIAGSLAYRYADNEAKDKT